MDAVELDSTSTGPPEMTLASEIWALTVLSISFTLTETPTETETPPTTPPEPANARAPALPMIEEESRTFTETLPVPVVVTSLLSFIDASMLLPMTLTVVEAEPAT